MLLLARESSSYQASAHSFRQAARTSRSCPLPKRRNVSVMNNFLPCRWYLYSLQPPPNPNRLDAAAEIGRKVFEREGCPLCHTPPHYTNNKLLPVSGFRIPPEHLTKYDIMQTPIDTDPRLTLQTRRGTGYYKVPSLRGVWCRSAFEHNGS